MGDLLGRKLLPTLADSFPKPFENMRGQGAANALVAGPRPAAGNPECSHSGKQSVPLHVGVKGPGTNLLEGPMSDFRSRRHSDKRKAVGAPFFHFPALRNCHGTEQNGANAVCAELGTDDRRFGSSSSSSVSFGD